MGVTSFGKKNTCSLATAFQDIIPALPWIFRETGLIPEYEIFKENCLFAENIEDNAVAESHLEIIAVKSSGPAAEKQRSRFGRYLLTTEVHNKMPVWQQDG